ncbi:MAG: hypothetical protein RMZ43_000455 [Nostoc sp. CmiVER01]|uniref:hypothetical protein n=1 Tax=Nostoc sp. CmiVER01 TaxID=3075384 RepID=UPI003D16052C
MLKLEDLSDDIFFITLSSLKNRLQDIGKQQQSGFGGVEVNTVQLSISFFSLRPWRPWRFVKKIEFDKEF